MADLSLETVYTSPEFFGIATATPVQRALCRIAEGVPLGELATYADVRDAVGGQEALDVLAPGGVRPKEVDVMAAIRSGKSFFACAHAFWSAMTAKVEHLKAGEIPRYSILSINLTSADVTFGILAGTILGKPALKRLLVGEVGADSLMLRHPSGRPVEVRVAAGARAGANLVSVWLLGVTFEEYARQAGEGQGAVVNFDQQLQAAIGRVLEGGQILSVGSPWAPFGPAYERHATSFGHPSPERVVVKAAGPAMNPSWWTPQRCEALQKQNPSAYVTDVLAGFCDPTTSFLTNSEVKAAIRKEPAVLPPRKGYLTLWAMDPATRGNAWTLCGVAYFTDKEGVTRYQVVRAQQWIGSPSQPLNAYQTLGAIKAIVAPYGIHQVLTDQHCADAYVDIGERMGLEVLIRTVIAGTPPEGKPSPVGRVYRNELFGSLKGAFATGTIEIPDDRVLISDLLSVQRIVTRTSLAYELPVTTDGRHCDFVSSLSLALSQFPTAGDMAAAGRAVEAREAWSQNINDNLTDMNWGTEVDRIELANRRAFEWAEKKRAAHAAGRASIAAENEAAIAKEEAEKRRQASSQETPEQKAWREALEARVVARMQRDDDEKTKGRQ